MPRYKVTGPDALSGKKRPLTNSSTATAASSKKAKRTVAKANAAKQTARELAEQIKSQKQNAVARSHANQPKNGKRKGLSLRGFVVLKCLLTSHRWSMCGRHWALNLIASLQLCSEVTDSNARFSAWGKGKQ